MKKLLVFLIIVLFIGSANMFAMQLVGDANKVQALIDSKQVTEATLVSFAKVPGKLQDKFRISDADYKAWLATPQGQAQIAAVVPAPVPTPAPILVGQFKKQYGKQCPRRPGKFRTGRGKFRMPEERVSRMVRRAALSKGNIQDANTVIVAMQQAVRDLANDPDIQNLPAVAPAVAAVIPQAQVAPQFRRIGKPAYYGRRYGKWQRKVRTQDEMVARIRCIALSKGSLPDANAFIAAMDKTIGDLVSDQKIKSLPNK